MMFLEIPKYPKEFIDAYVRYMTSKYIDEILKGSVLSEISNYDNQLRQTFGTNSKNLKKCLIKEHYFQENHYCEIIDYVEKQKPNLKEFVKKKLGTENKVLINSISNNTFSDYKIGWYHNFIEELDTLIKNKSVKIKNHVESIKKTTTIDFPNYFKELILLHPKEMDDFIKNGYNLDNSNFKSIQKLYNLSKTIEIKGHEEKINNYIVQNFIYSSGKGLLVCPYCNRNYINNRGKSLSAQIDHFYNKSQFPIFAVSLYNYVPSCGTCNLLKKDNNLKLNPYLKGENDNIKFNFSLKQDGFQIEIKHLKNGVLMNIDKSPDLNNDLITILKLEKAYEIHEVEIAEMVNREREYGQEYRNSLTNLLSGTEEEINKKIDTLIYGEVVFTQENELINKSLGKFKKDAYEKIKEWKFSE